MEEINGGFSAPHKVSASGRKDWIISRAKDAIESRGFGRALGDVLIEGTLGDGDLNIAWRLRIYDDGNRMTRITSTLAGCPNCSGPFVLQRKWGILCVDCHHRKTSGILVATDFVDMESIVSLVSMEMKLRMPHSPMGTVAVFDADIISMHRVVEVQWTVLREGGGCVVTFIQFSQGRVRLEEAIEYIDMTSSNLQKLSGVRGDDLLKNIDLALKGLETLSVSEVALESRHLLEIPPPKTGCNLLVLRSDRQLSSAQLVRIKSQSVRRIYFYVVGMDMDWDGEFLGELVSRMEFGKTTVQQSSIVDDSEESINVEVACTMMSRHDGSIEALYHLQGVENEKSLERVRDRMGAEFVRIPATMSLKTSMEIYGKAGSQGGAAMKTALVEIIGSSKSATGLNEEGPGHLVIKAGECGIPQPLQADAPLTHRFYMISFHPRVEERTFLVSFNSSPSRDEYITLEFRTNEALTPCKAAGVLAALGVDVGFGLPLSEDRAERTGSVLKALNLALLKAVAKLKSICGERGLVWKSSSLVKLYVSGAAGGKTLQVESRLGVLNLPSFISALLKQSTQFVMAPEFSFKLVLMELEGPTELEVWTGMPAYEDISALLMVNTSVTEVTDCYELYIRERGSCWGTMILRVQLNFPGPPCSTQRLYALSQAGRLIRRNLAQSLYARMIIHLVDGSGMMYDETQRTEEVGGASLVKCLGPTIVDNISLALSYDNLTITAIGQDSKGHEREEIEAELKDCEGELQESVIKTGTGAFLSRVAVHATYVGLTINAGIIFALPAGGRTLDGLRVVVDEVFAYSDWIGSWEAEISYSGQPWKGRLKDFGLVELLDLAKGSAKKNHPITFILDNALFIQASPLI